MGCALSSFDDSCVNRETAKFYYVGRVRAFVAMHAIIERYNEGLEKRERITQASFVNECVPVDAARMIAVLAALRIPTRLLWFIRHAIGTEHVHLPARWGSPDMADILEDLDLVEAPGHVKRDFVAFMECPFNAGAFRRGSDPWTHAPRAASEHQLLANV